MSVHPYEARRALLRTAAKVLHSRMPTWQARFHMEGVAYRARFEWPGVVTVADDNTGEVLARSVSGEPEEADADTIRRDFLNGRA